MRFIPRYGCPLQENLDLGNVIIPSSAYSIATGHDRLRSVSAPQDLILARSFQGLALQVEKGELRICQVNNDHGRAPMESVSTTLGRSGKTLCFANDSCPASGLKA